MLTVNLGMEHIKGLLFQQGGQNFCLTLASKNKFSEASIATVLL